MKLSVLTPSSGENRCSGQSEGGIVVAPQDDVSSYEIGNILHERRLLFKQVLVCIMAEAKAGDAPDAESGANNHADGWGSIDFETTLWDAPDAESGANNHADGWGSIDFETKIGVMPRMESWWYPPAEVSSCIGTESGRLVSGNRTENCTSEGIVTDGGAKFDTRRQQLNLVTQVTRANIIQNVLGHRWMLPSLKEINYCNPSKSKGTLTDHINKLVESDILIRAKLPQGKQQRNLPNTFFTLSDEGYQLLDQHSLFLPALDVIREDHGDRLDKTEDIKKYEMAPRPTVNVVYEHPLKGDGMTIVDPKKIEDNNKPAKH